jgi:heat shock protein HslJ
MSNTKNVIIVLLLIALAVLAYVIWADTDNQAMETSNLNDNQSQNGNSVSEPPAPVPTPNPNSSQTPSEKFADNNWLLVGLVVDEKAVDMNVKVPQAMTLNFDKAKKTYNGFAGCNSFSGSYTASGADKFAFGSTVSTKMYCLDSSDLENRLMTAMERVSSYMITAEGNLVLKSNDGKAKIEYKPAI